MDGGGLVNLIFFTRTNYKIKMKNLFPTFKNKVYIHI